MVRKLQAAVTAESATTDTSKRSASAKRSRQRCGDHWNNTHRPHLTILRNSVRTTSVKHDAQSSSASKLTLLAHPMINIPNLVERGILRSNALKHGPFGQETASMTTSIVDEFANYLSSRHFNAASLLAKLEFNPDDDTATRRCETFGRRPISRPTTSPTRLRRSIGCRVLTLPQLIAATPLTAKFSRRFLRETMVFPYPHAGRTLPARARRPDRRRGRARRRDRARRHRSRSRSPPSRTSRIVLAKRLGEDDEPATDADEAATERSRRRHREPARSCQRRAGGARASTICSSARSSCAPPTSTSSRSAPASWCACASTGCCARCRRRPACCRRR